MTGPENYAAAERLAARAEDLASGDPGDQAAGQVLASAAQARATLALAAATALSRPGEGLPSADWKAWLSAAAVSA